MIGILQYKRRNSDIFIIKSPFNKRELLIIHPCLCFDCKLRCVKKSKTQKKCKKEILDMTENIALQFVDEISEQKIEYRRL